MIEATNQNAINKSIDEAHYYNVFVWNHKNLEEKHKKTWVLYVFVQDIFTWCPTSVPFA